MVFKAPYSSKKAFTQQSLGEYARHPLFGTVGIDASYYNPLTVAQYQRYADQLPEGFRCLIKVWEAITTPVYPKHARYGARGGQENAGFLDPELFTEAVYGPTYEIFQDHAGPLVFEFAPMPPEHQLSPPAFCAALDAFLEAIPKGLTYGVELRNRAYFTPRYLKVLRRHGVCHVLNLWSWMPSPAEQMRKADIFTGPMVVARFMISPGVRYGERAASWSPYDQLRKVSAQHRQEAVDLLIEAHRRGMEAYLIINNKVEGCSPLTVKAVTDATAAALKESRP